jgi:hypothetical protein
MDLATFQTLLDAHGGDPERWPARDRATALDFVARSPEAAQALAAARRLDGLLGAGLAAQASANLRFRITAGAATTRVPAAGSRGWALFGRWGAGAATAAAAASIALGMVVGMETSVATVLEAEPAQTMDLAALAYGEVDGLEDIQ